GRSFESMDDPAFQLRIARDGESKRWIALNGSLVKLLPFFEFLQVLHRVLKIVRLDKSEIGLAVFRGLAFESRFFRGRKLGLERVGDFLREIGLNGKHIRHIAIIIARPNMLVTVGVDQLHVYPHLVAGAADAAFENVRNSELLADLANIRSLAAITHDGSARDHFELTDFRKVGQNVILHSIGKEGVLLVVAQIFEWQHRNRFVQLARDRAGEEKKTGGRGNDHAGGDEHNDIAATMRSRHGDRRRRFYTRRRDVKRPGQDKRDRKSGEQQHNDQTLRPVRQLPRRKDRRCDLDDPSRYNDVG